ncbi:MAG: PmbA/TldA family metallopeptidase, partial [Clostridium sp.]
MLSKDIVSKVIQRCLITGGDFAEVFEEDTIDNSINILDGKVESSISGRSYGVGIRIFKGLKSVYTYTNNNSLTSLLDVAHKAALALGEVKEEGKIILNNSIVINNNPVIYLPSSISLNKKIGVMRIAYNGAKNYNSEISQVSVGYSDKEQRVLIANSEGLYTEDQRVRTRLYISSIASANGENQTGTEGPGR